MEIDLELLRRVFCSEAEEHLGEIEQDLRALVQRVRSLDDCQRLPCERLGRVEVSSGQKLRTYTAPSNLCMKVGRTCVAFVNPQVVRF